MNSILINDESAWKNALFRVFYTNKEMVNDSLKFHKNYKPASSLITSGRESYISLKLSLQTIIKRIVN